MPLPFYLLPLPLLLAPIGNPLTQDVPHYTSSVFLFVIASPEPDDLDGSYLGTPTALAINDTNKVKRSQPFTTQGREETTAPSQSQAGNLGQSQAGNLGQSQHGAGGEPPVQPSAGISSIDDLRKVEDSC